MFVFSWDPLNELYQLEYLRHNGNLADIFKKLIVSTSLGSMQYLELEYLLGIEHEGDRNADGRRSNFDVI